MNWTKDDIITSDKYLAAFPRNYYKMDAIYYNRPIVWRNAWHTPPPPSARLVVSGHSDFPVTDQVVSRYPFARWFGINKQTPNCRGLPLGITNDTNESDLHRIYGNVDMMAEVASQPRNVKNLAYMNFSVGTYPTERQKVWDMFKDKSWVTCGESINSMEGRKAFLSDIRNHQYVLCPRGNGIDTHRLWETLYMGSIPIVLWDIAHSDWTDLPILFVRSWEQVTEEFLTSQLHRFANTPWNYNKLHVGYWIRQIQG
jgi:hypothetical protein